MENRFDILAKMFAGEGSRREMVRRFGGLLAGVSLAGTAACDSDPTGPQASRFAGRPAFQLDTPGRCRRNGHKCRESAECCSNFCDPTTGYCTCGPFSEVCPQTDQCVPACRPPLVFNSQTCKCECSTGFETCGNEANQFCCFSQFQRCCRTSNALGSATCCPNTYLCCTLTYYAGDYAFCCPPTTTCCTSPAGYAACCPSGTRCCIRPTTGETVCVSVGAPCPTI